MANSGYALSGEPSRGQLSDWDQEIGSLMLGSRIFTPPVVPASRVNAVRHRGSEGEATGPQVREMGLTASTRCHLIMVRRAGQPNAGPCAPFAQIFHNTTAGAPGVVDLIYDPMLNCYYDAATSQYYAIK